MSKTSLNKFTILIIMIVNSLNLLTLTISTDPNEITDPKLKMKFEFYNKVKNIHKNDNLEIFIEENELFMRTKNNITITENTPTKILDLSKDYVFISCKINLKYIKIIKLLNRIYNIIYYNIKKNFIKYLNNKRRLLSL